MPDWGTAEAATRKPSGATDEQAKREKGTTAHLYFARLIPTERAYNDTAEVFRPGQEWPGEAIGMVGWFNRRLRRDREDGAVLVEFALVLPIFIVIVFGIMEAGWAFAQQVEVRNAAREGARLAVVDYPTPGTANDGSAIVAATCSRAALSADRASVALVLNLSGAGTEDDSAIVTVSQDYESLTGLIPAFNNLTITSTAEMRLERDSVAWTNIPVGNVLGDCP
jgi:Flp pilus assembly protein TadG